ncbi:hypothetical protein HK096_011279 [Nowakowskiella sp. JEL0078]|nr:hypothetical protein HK096_011279 [Nowakowskiella sp. JEL0078]
MATPQSITTDDPCVGCIFHDQDDTGNPTCTEHAQIPAYLAAKIEQGDMHSTVKPYSLHLLISLPSPNTGNYWPEHIDDPRKGLFTPEASSEVYNVWVAIEALSKTWHNERRGRIMVSVVDRIPNISVAGSNDRVEVLVMPDLISIEFPESVSVSAALELLKSALDSKTGNRMKNSGRWNAESNVVKEQVEADAVVLVCTHKKRDKRCGVAGPLIVEQFEKVIKVENIGNVAVYGVSHPGGHKWAGNVLVYKRDKAVWYGRVQTCHVEAILKRTVLGDEIFEQIWRGNMPDDALASFFSLIRVFLGFYLVLTAAACLSKLSPTSSISRNTLMDSSNEPLEQLRGMLKKAFTQNFMMTGDFFASESWNLYFKIVNRKDRPYFDFLFDDFQTLFILSVHQSKNSEIDSVPGKVYSSILMGHAEELYEFGVISSEQIKSLRLLCKSTDNKTDELLNECKIPFDIVTQISILKCLSDRQRIESSREKQFALQEYAAKIFSTLRLSLISSEIKLSALSEHPIASIGILENSIEIFSNIINSVSNFDVAKGIKLLSTSFEPPFSIVYHSSSRFCPFKHIAAFIARNPSQHLNENDISLYKALKASGMKPDVSLMNFLLSFRAEAKDYVGVGRILDEMKFLELKINNVTYSIIASTCTEQNDWEGAKEAFFAARDCVNEDKVAIPGFLNTGFRSLIRIAAEKNDLNTMFLVYLSARGSKQSPDQVNYSSIDIPAERIGVIDKSCFATIIFAYINQGDWKMAGKISKDMLRDTKRAQSVGHEDFDNIFNADLYRNVIKKFLLNKYYDSAISLLRGLVDLQKNQIAILNFSYNYFTLDDAVDVIVSCALAGYSNDAHSLFLEIFPNNKNPWNAPKLIRAFLDINDEFAEIVLIEALKSKIHIDDEAKDVINFLVISGQSEKVSRIWKNFKSPKVAAPILESLMMQPNTGNIIYSIDIIRELIRNNIGSHDLIEHFLNKIVKDLNNECLVMIPPESIFTTEDQILKVTDRFKVASELISFLTDSLKKAKISFSNPNVSQIATTNLIRKILSEIGPLMNWQTTWEGLIKNYMENRIEILASENKKSENRSITQELQLATKYLQNMSDISIAPRSSLVTSVLEELEKISKYLDPISLKETQELIVEIWDYSIRKYGSFAGNPNTLIALKALSELDPNRAVELAVSVANVKNYNSRVHASVFVKDVIATLGKRRESLMVFDAIKSSNDLEIRKIPGLVDAEINLNLEMSRTQRAFKLYQEMKLEILNTVHNDRYRETVNKLGFRQKSFIPTVLRKTFVKLLENCLANVDIPAVCELFNDLALLQQGSQGNRNEPFQEIRTLGLPDSLLSVDVPAGSFILAAKLLLAHDLPEEVAIVIQCANIAQKKRIDRDSSDKTLPYIDPVSLKETLFLLSKKKRLDLAWTLVNEIVLKNNCEIVYDCKDIRNAVYELTSVSNAILKTEETPENIKIAHQFLDALHKIEAANDPPDYRSTVFKRVWGLIERPRAELNKELRRSNSNDDNVINEIQIKNTLVKIETLDNLGESDEVGVPLILKFPFGSESEEKNSEYRMLYHRNSIQYLSNGYRNLNYVPLSVILSRIRDLRSIGAVSLFPESLMRMDGMYFIDKNILGELIKRFSLGDMHLEAAELIRDSTYVYKNPNIFPTSALTFAKILSIIEKYNKKSSEFKLSHYDVKIAEVAKYFLESIIKSVLSDRQNQNKTFEIFVTSVCSNMTELSPITVFFDLLENIVNKVGEIMPTGLFREASKAAILKQDNEAIQALWKFANNSYTKKIKIEAQATLLESWVRIIIQKHEREGPEVVFDQIKQQTTLTNGIVKLVLDTFERKIKIDGSDSQWLNQIQTFKEKTETVTNGDASSIDNFEFQQKMMDYNETKDTSAASELWDTVLLANISNVNNMKITLFQPNEISHKIYFELLLNHPTQREDSVKAYKLLCKMKYRGMNVSNKFLLTLIEQLMEWRDKEHLELAFTVLAFTKIDDQSSNPMRKYEIPLVLYIRFLDEVAKFMDRSRIKGAIEFLKNSGHEIGEIEIQVRNLYDKWMEDQLVEAASVLFEEFYGFWDSEQKFAMLKSLSSIVSHEIDVRKLYMKLIHSDEFKTLMTTRNYFELIEANLKRGRVNAAEQMCMDCIKLNSVIPPDDILTDIVYQMLDKSQLSFAKKFIRHLVFYSPKESHISPRLNELLLQKHAEQGDYVGAWDHFIKMINLLKKFGLNKCGKWESRMLLPIIVSEIVGQSYKSSSNLLNDLGVNIQASTMREIKKRIKEKTINNQAWSEFWDDLGKFWDRNVKSEFNGMLNLKNISSFLKEEQIRKSGKVYKKIISDSLQRREEFIRAQESTGRKEYEDEEIQGETNSEIFNKIEIK